MMGNQMKKRQMHTERKKFTDYLRKKNEYFKGGKNMNTFEIYFSDLNEDAQRRLLEAVGAETAADMNWDIDMCPIAMYDFETETE